MGKRQGAGRKAGPNWDGSGQYAKRARALISFKPENLTWLREEARRTETSMADVVNALIDKAKNPA